MTCSPEGRQQLERVDVKWEKEVERMMKQRNITSNEAVTWQL
jgi:hypothetical protein